MIFPPFLSLHQRLFSSISSTSIDKFTRFCYQRDLPKAMSVLSTRQKQSIWADSVTYLEFIKCCLAHGATNKVKLIHNHVFSNGFGFAVPLRSLLCLKDSP